MGDILQGETKRLVVTDGARELTPVSFTASVDDTSIATVAERGDQAEWDFHAVGAGTVTVTVTGANDELGRSGQATFTVDPVPLVVALGDPLP